MEIHRESLVVLGIKPGLAACKAWYLNTLVTSPMIECWWHLNLDGSYWTNMVWQKVPAPNIRELKLVSCATWSLTGAVCVCVFVCDIAWTHVHTQACETEWQAVIGFFLPLYFLFLKFFYLPICICFLIFPL